MLSELQKRRCYYKKTNINNEKTPFNDNCFDAIVCLDVIEHVFDPRTLIKEISRVIKNNCILIISVPNIRHTLLETSVKLDSTWKISKNSRCK
jgi:2-polyprenyl-3-methyl-5-hydroxy-6-metoxy-1,4-benzoquinol methylase